MLDFANSDPNFMNIIITGDESWVFGYNPEPFIFLTMTRALNTTSLKCCLPSTDAIDKGKKLHAGVLRVKVALFKRASFEIPQVFAKKKVEYFSNRVVYIPYPLEMTCPSQNTPN